MKARKYNKVIELWQAVEVPDGYGGNIIVEQFLRKSWCEIKTVSNNSRFSQRLTELGVTDPSRAIIIMLRHRNDIPYNAVNQFFKYRGEKYVIQNAPTNINIEDVDVEIIAIREQTKSVPILTS